MTNFDPHNDTPHITMHTKQPKPNGRPPKNPKECRSQKILFTMTPPERVSLERLARKYNCSMNDVLRQALQVAY
jgi:hypothetical protein